MKTASFQSRLCRFLQCRAEIDECIRFLDSHGFILHACEPKNWDLAHIIPEIGDGNFLDMGSYGGCILKNIVLKRIHGKLYGIDLQGPDAAIRGVNYITGDLMDSGLPRNFFKNITCLSVIEHQIDFVKFARETACLLEDKGRVFVTFDYWNPKITSNVKIFGLGWQPLDEKSLRQFIDECEKNNLYLIQDMDYKISERVIREGYYSPDPKSSYTFGMAVFEKRQKDGFI